MGGLQTYDYITDSYGMFIFNNYQEHGYLATEKREAALKPRAAVSVRTDPGLLDLTRLCKQITREVIGSIGRVT